MHFGVLILDGHIIPMLFFLDAFSNIKDCVYEFSPCDIFSLKFNGLLSVIDRVCGPQFVMFSSTAGFMMMFSIKSVIF